MIRLGRQPAFGVVGHPRFLAAIGALVAPTMRARTRKRAEQIRGSIVGHRNEVKAGTCVQPETVLPVLGNSLRKTAEKRLRGATQANQRPDFIKYSTILAA
jgi:hypothetical protein